LGRIWAISSRKIRPGRNDEKSKVNFFAKKKTKNKQKTNKKGEKYRMYEDLSSYSSPHRSILIISPNYSTVIIAMYD
jgi:hypothetical protein